MGDFCGLSYIDTRVSFNSFLAKTLPQPLAEKLDMTTLLQGMLQLGYPIRAISTGALWLECDSGQDIKVYEREFL